MFFETVLWRVTCPNQASFRLFTVARRGSSWTHKEVDLAPHPVTGLVFQVGDAEKFTLALAFESLDLFSQSQQAQSWRRTEVTIRDLYELDLLAKLMVLLRQIPFNLAIAEATCLQRCANNILLEVLV